MADIYRSGVTLPIEILFIGNPRLKDPGLRWALSSFLNNSKNYFMFSGNKYALLSSAGLLLFVDCILFDPKFDMKPTNGTRKNLCSVNCPGGLKFGFT